MIVPSRLGRRACLPYRIAISFVYISVSSFVFSSSHPRSLLLSVIHLVPSLLLLLWPDTVLNGLGEVPLLRQRLQPIGVAVLMWSPQDKNLGQQLLFTLPVLVNLLEARTLHLSIVLESVSTLLLLFLQFKMRIPICPSSLKQCCLAFLPLRILERAPQSR